MPLISPPDWYSLWGTMTSDKSQGHSWMNSSLLALGLIHPSCPACKLKLENVRFQEEILNNCPFLTWVIDSPWFFASDRSWVLVWIGNLIKLLCVKHRVDYPFWVCYWPVCKWWVQPNQSFTNLLSQATQVPGWKISARLQGGTQVQVTVDLSAQRRPQGDVGMAIFTTENQNPPWKTYKEEKANSRNRTLDMENVSEQPPINLHPQVLVVLLIMIALCQWSILLSSSTLESQERNGIVHLEIQWTFSHTSITSTLDLSKRCLV